VALRVSAGAGSAGIPWVWLQAYCRVLVSQQRGLVYACCAGASSVSLLETRPLCLRFAGLHAVPQRSLQTLPLQVLPSSLMLWLCAALIFHQNTCASCTVSA
jgi:hypothetical protein